MAQFPHRVTDFITVIEFGEEQVNNATNKHTIVTVIVAGIEIRNINTTKHPHILESYVGLVRWQYQMSCCV